MDFNVSFVPAETPIQASVNRVVAMWYADVDKFAIDGDAFTGAVALFAVYSLAATQQYFLALFDMNGNLAKIMQARPQNIHIYNSPKFESAIIEYLKTKQVLLMPVLRDTTAFGTILKKLPLLMHIDDETPCIGDFQLETLNALKGLTLSAADRETIKSFVTLF